MKRKDVCIIDDELQQVWSKLFMRFTENVDSKNGETCTVVDL